ncbi:alkane hydroxylase MAH1-like [Rutidosis leptorrhynchoides]|uniref:alkane hydroxylase MAH1-like n=1 Tax=Rutidosis leptorrhynchoides TaxID=125765 RepID=UPI003A99E507
MPFLDYLVVGSLVFSIILLLTLVSKFRNQRDVVPTNWPILGMTPSSLVNIHRVHDYVTEVLTQTGGTFMSKGPWFAKMDMLFTTNPLDIHHILSKNFNNYPKGKDFQKLFDIMGDGVFNSDGELWEIHRKVTMSVLKHPRFQTLLETILWNKVEKGLIPVLESVSTQEKETDLQEIFQRFTFDTICKLLLDHDPETLSIEFRYVPCQKAFADAEEAILYRHYMPRSLWKLQQILKIGSEKKLSDARVTLDRFIYECLSRKSKELNNMNDAHKDENFLVLTAMAKEFKDQGVVVGDQMKFLRDTLVNLMVAGKDSTSSTLSWFFYILAQKPTIQDNILKEIHTHLGVKSGKRWRANELCEMVYLNGALSESLRLFPPLPFNHKIPLRRDILPSGHEVDENMKIILSIYSMGRMKSIWGEDCMEFKPERWITKLGKIKHEPSYKFPAFNAGPRTCLAKDMSLYEMKIVSTTIIQRYRIDLVEGHIVKPSGSMVLQMKHGVKVRLTRRSEMN